MLTNIKLQYLQKKVQKCKENAIRTHMTHCHKYNFDNCKFFRIFVGWEGGVAFFGNCASKYWSVHASMTK